MSSTEVQESGFSRINDDVNFTKAQLSLTKDTIWSSYFLNIYSRVPSAPRSENIPSNSVKDTSLPLADLLGQKEAAPNLTLKGIYTIKQALKEQQVPEFRRKFLARETFRGYVSALSGDDFIAVVEDHRGDKFEYKFDHEELPPQQRASVSVGSPVVIHVGHEFVNKTKYNMIKLYIANYAENKMTKNNLIEKKMAKWKF